MKHTKSLALFFTVGIDVKLRKERGLLAREKEIYEYHLNQSTFDKVFRCTYGSDDLSYSNELHPDIVILQKPSYRFFKGIVGNILYSLVLPWFHMKTLAEVDIFKSNQMLGARTALLAKRFFKKTLWLRTGFTESLTAEKFYTKFIFTFVESILYRYADISSVSSKYQKEYLEKKYKPKNLHIITNYIDTERFSPKTKERKIGNIIFVGRLTEIKNLHLLIEVMKENTYTLDIYGQGNLQETIATQIKTYGLGDRVRLKGVVKNSELPDIYSGYDIYILTSKREGMPKTLLEAMSTGVASIGTNVQGINEVIDHMENGYLVDESTESIAEGIQTLMNNETLRNTLGDQARKKIVAGYSIQAIAALEKTLLSPYFHENTL